MNINGTEYNISPKSDLRGAYLWRANLQGAYLQGADLQDANLQGADLRGADLQDANLRGAYLWRADLQDADLQGADLRGAKNIATVSNIGSRGDTLIGVLHKEKVIFKTGCFWGDRKKFITSLHKTHGTTELEIHKQYIAALSFLELMLTKK